MTAKPAQKPDIVERLRNNRTYADPGHHNMIDTAIDEIVRLRAALEDIEGKCADAIGGRINYRAGDLQMIARRALGRKP